MATQVHRGVDNVWDGYRRLRVEFVRQLRLRSRIWCSAFVNFAEDAGSGQLNSMWQRIISFRKGGISKRRRVELVEYFQCLAVGLLGLLVLAELMVNQTNAPVSEGCLSEDGRVIALLRRGTSGRSSGHHATGHREWVPFAARAARLLVRDASQHLVHGRQGVLEVFLGILLGQTWPEFHSPWRGGQCGFLFAECHSLHPTPRSFRPPRELLPPRRTWPRSIPQVVPITPTTRARPADLPPAPDPCSAGRTFATDSWRTADTPAPPHPSR